MGNKRITYFPACDSNWQPLTVEPTIYFCEVIDPLWIIQLLQNFYLHTETSWLFPTWYSTQDAAEVFEVWITVCFPSDGFISGM